VVVAALAAGPVGSLTGAVLPAGNGFVALLEVAVTAAVLANVVNNLPATLLVLGLLADRTGGVLPVFAALVGLNVGPNLTYQGSLATLLWRRIVPPEDRPGLRTFAVAGLATVPVTLVLAVAALWAVARLVP
jgi:arsenical pump membrane protein